MASPDYTSNDKEEYSNLYGSQNSLFRHVTEYKRFIPWYYQEFIIYPNYGIATHYFSFQYFTTNSLSTEGLARLDPPFPPHPLDQMNNFD